MAAAQVAGEVRVSDLEAPAGYGYNGYGWLGRVWVSPLIHLSHNYGFPLRRGSFLSSQGIFNEENVSGKNVLLTPKCYENE